MISTWQSIHKADIYFFSFQNIVSFTERRNNHKMLLVLDGCDSNCIFSDFYPVTLTTCIVFLWWVCLCILALNDGFCLSIVFYSELTGNGKTSMLYTIKWLWIPGELEIKSIAPAKGDMSSWKFMKVGLLLIKELKELVQQLGLAGAESSKRAR